jgi:hypothetical protein
MLKVRACPYKHQEENSSGTPCVASLIYSQLSSLQKYTNIDMAQRWNPKDVLQLCSDGRCVGHAPSKGRKCMMPIRQDNIRQREAISEDLARQQPDAALLSPTLRRLAGHGLCVKFHQDQVDEMVRKWTVRLRTAFPRGVVEHVTPTIVPTRNSRRSTTTEIAASPELDEAQRLRECIAAMQERLDLLQSVPSVENPSPTVSPASSAVSSRTVSRSSTPPLTAVSSRTVSNSPTPQSSPPPQAPSSVPATITVGQPARRRVRNLPNWLTSPDLQVNRMDAQTRPALPLRGSASTSAAQQPMPPTAATRHCSLTHVRRLPYEEECHICCDETPLSACAPPDLVWCRSGCGRTVHKVCFDRWIESQTRSNPLRQPTCTICRTSWGEACDCLEGCSDVHVRRKRVNGNCSVCQEDLRGRQNGTGEWSMPKLLWCKDGCGGNVHEACFAPWRNACSGEEREATCTLCRAEWVDRCEC